MTMLALAVDPGMSTGAAALISSSGGHTIWTSTVPAYDGNVRDVLNLVLQNRPKVVIMEQFLTRGLLSKYGIETIEIVGAIKAMQCLASEGGWQREGLVRFELIRRTPSQRIVRMPEATKYMQERRSSTGLKHTDHEIDALAHLFGWMRQEGIPYGHTNNTSALSTTPV